MIANSDGRWKWPAVKAPSLAPIDEVQRAREQDLAVARLEIKELREQVKRLLDPSWK